MNQFEKEFSELDGELQNIVMIVVKEVQSAIAKHPKWPWDKVHAAAIVCEESGELVRAALQWQYEKGLASEMEKEAIQTAAMGIRFILNK